MNPTKAKDHVNILPKTAYITKLDKYIWVRFFRCEGEKIISVEQCRFHYKEHRKETIDKAIEWRDNMYFDLLCQDKVNPYRADRPTRGKQTNNKSEKVGVQHISCTRKRMGRYGREYTFHIDEWHAVWVQYFREGDQVIRKPKRKSFAVKKWGDQAFQLACESREGMEEYLNSPEHIKLQQEYRKGK
jgi:hypothetical protein